MKKQYTHVTGAISPEGLEEFEKKLQYGIWSTHLGQEGKQY